MSSLRFCIGLLALLLLGACHPSGNPAPVYDGGNSSPRPLGAVNAVPVSQAGILETAGGRVAVQQGETLYAISRRSGVPVRSLIDANNLQPPYRLNAGQVLTLPSTRQHIVQQGETLYSVARRYNVEAASLARTNHIDPPYTIKLGQPLVLPPPVAEAPQVAGGPPPSALSPVGAVPVGPAPVGPAPAAPVPATTAPTVAPGGVTATPLPPPTPTGPPQALVPPATTAAPVPPPLPQRPVAPPPPAPVEAAAPPPAAAVSPPEPESVAPAPVAHAAAPTAAVASLVENHRAPTAPLFGWPVSGQIISTFGPAAGGTHNDGINISAPEGTTVAAAESGTVAYAGNELRGFGNLLLLKHDGGWVTAYAHNQVLLVKKGDKIRRGQAIARIGSTGGVGAPQLHFELRSGTKAVDPLDHLPQLTAGE